MAWQNPIDRSAIQRKLFRAILPGDSLANGGAIRSHGGT